MAGFRRFSRAIFEGDGIALLADVRLEELGRARGAQGRGDRAARARRGARRATALRARAEPETVMPSGKEPAAAFEPLSDEAAGTRSLADGRSATTDEIAGLERAALDAALVGDAPPAA